MDDARERLLALLESEGVALEERLRAGASLAELGDRRGIDGDRVAIPGGRFSMGEARDAVVLPGYAIDRYPAGLPVRLGAAALKAVLGP